MTIRHFLLALMGLILVNQASAVALNSGKDGQVLIFPYYSNLGGNQTLIQITKTLSGTSHPRALKVRFRDRDGLEVLSFNLYLAEDLWTAAIVRENGQSQLILPDKSCTVPQLKQGNNPIPVSLTSGFFEVIDMGELTEPTTANAARAFNCAMLELMWAEQGAWRNNNPNFELEPPKGRLRGTVQLINVGEGTLYSFVATALTEFSDIPQHTGPESAVPNLSTPHDEGTASGNTHSIRCFTDPLEPSHVCLEDTWVRPKDAVAAVLSSNELNGEYTINDEIGAKAELILTFPLQPYRTIEDKIPTVLLNIGNVSNPDAGVCLPPLITVPPCTGNYSQVTDQAVFLTSFNDNREEFGELVYPDILKDGHIVFFPEPGDPPLPVASSLGVYLPLTWGDQLISNSGTKYSDTPVIGYILQKYTNGFLTNGQGEKIKANYGNTFELSRKGN